MPKGNPQGHSTGRDHPQKQPPAGGGQGRSEFGRKVQPGPRQVPQGEAQRSVGRDHPTNRDPLAPGPVSDPFPGRK